MGASKNLEIVFPAQAGIQVCQQYPVFIKLGVKACLDAFAGTTGFLEVPNLLCAIRIFLSAKAVMHF